MKNINFKKIFLTIFLFISLFGDSQSSLYFPLKKGNKFIFHYYYSQYTIYGQSSGYYDFKCEITKDTIINNKKYFFVRNYDPNTNQWFRVDTITGSLYRYDPTNSCIYYYYETLVDSLLMPLHGSSNSCNVISVDSIMYVTKWNIPCTEKTYHRLDFGMSVTNTTRIYNSYFGSVGRFWSQSNSFCSSSESITLKGCIIDSVMYGDTVVINISRISNQIPSEFTLSQNYPNPFNPVTKIRFAIPVDSRLRGNNKIVLKVYDMLGREVRTLVNEPLQPGTYEAEFDGSGLNSGVYFYRLTAGDFTETRKMVMLK